MKTAQGASPSLRRTHTSLSPRTNLLLICVWALVVCWGLVIVQPRLPLALALAGGLCGALAGVMQHLSIKKKTLPNSDDSPSGSAHLSEFPFSEGFDVTHRRLAEGAAVFAIEMTDTFVSDLKGHS